MKHIAVYVRVSSKQQDQRSQEPELRRWAGAQEGEVVWYRDTFTGRTMKRPGMTKLLHDVEAGKVSTIVVWLLDRLGRTAKGLTALFEDLRAKPTSPGTRKERATPARPGSTCRPTASITIAIRPRGAFPRAARR